MYKTPIFLTTCLLALLMGVGSADAQGKKKSKKKSKARADVAQVVEAAKAPEAVPENTFDTCQDNWDNDYDSHIDCEDQDCEIFAMCAAPNVVPDDDADGPLMDPNPPLPVEPVPPPMKPTREVRRMCVDGIDNDEDGLVDCFDKDCHRERYCRRQIYFVPEPKNKAPGLFISLGGGVALPNFRGESEGVESTFFGDVPFYPDMGIMAQLKIGYLLVPWIGLGISTNGGVTSASNRYETDGSDKSFRYKYEAFKGFGQLHAFLRLQFPAGRFVPYVDLSAGYSYVVQEWSIYDGDEDWEDIDDDESQLRGIEEIRTKEYRHFTMNVEPGFDIFLRKRAVAMGLHAILPVWSSSEPSTDNIGVMLHLTFTPMWRERARLKPEYENPAATYEEELGEPEPTLADPFVVTAPEEGTVPVEAEASVEGEVVSEGVVKTDAETTVAKDAPVATVEEEASEKVEEPVDETADKVEAKTEFEDDPYAEEPKPEKKKKRRSKKKKSKKSKKDKKDK